MAFFHNPRLVGSIIVFASTIMLVFLVIKALNAWQAYSDAFALAERRAETTVELLRQQVDATIEISELVLDALVTHGRDDHGVANHSDITHDHHLMAMANHLPFGPWLMGIDTDGNLIYIENARNSPAAGDQAHITNHGHADHGNPSPAGHGTHGHDAHPHNSANHHPPAHSGATDSVVNSNPAHMTHGGDRSAPSSAAHTPAVSESGRPAIAQKILKTYLDMHRSQLDSNPMIGPPITKASGEGWFFGVSRKFTAPDGSFAGVAVILLDASFLKALADTANLADQSELGLLGSDGAPLVWLAFDGGEANLVASSSTHFVNDAEASPSGTVRIKGKSGNDSHILAYRPVGDIVGLTAAVTIFEPAVFEQWLATRITDILVILAFGIILALMAIPAFHLIVRPLRQIQSALNNVRDGNFDGGLVASTGVREINAVMIGVEEMRKSLKALTENLNSEVAKRTQELTVANTELENHQHELTQAKLTAESANVAKSDFLQI